ncbi:uncharacterized protein LOC132050784 [Lycium ferocissimum]|uniref:uncharacterized protein LOC132050784 n=1 Tax=Lycium ferocissimum TaxID=112874 RepID=UPI0028155C01|nr:uncharacterized protein LOC132050784 [Lycium ferocissimum]
MSENPNCSVYVGNLDERVGDRVLYNILIQAGHVINLYIPHDRKTDKPKGFAFVKYETEEIANYAVKLFSGLVTLYNRTLIFSISGQHKPSNNLSILSRSRPHLAVPYNNDKGFSANTVRLSTSCRSDYDGNNYDYGRRVFGVASDNIDLNSWSYRAHSRLGQYNTRV